MSLKRVCPLLWVVVLASCGSSDPADETEGLAPVVGGFTVSPSVVARGVATAVTWTWGYDNAPDPAPDCSIDQGVGQLESGDSTMVTLDSDTTFTLTCTNAAGSDAAQVTIVTTADAAVVPEIEAFTVTPSSIPAGVATEVTWSWSYSNDPTPPPGCTVDNGVEQIASGDSTYLTLDSDTTFTLTCTNSAGSDSAQTSVNVL